ncbi:hypothetical protein K438DRAFT_1642349, partial [Mycena galopus ATCC 62051]
FALPDADKLALDVRNGGIAWRGYMPLGGEGTHGHGKNQFPSEEQVSGLRAAVLDYIAEVTKVSGGRGGTFTGLELEAGYLKTRLPLARAGRAVSLLQVHSYRASGGRTSIRHRGTLLHSGTYIYPSSRFCIVEA